jgi:hypothetical protein
MFQFRISQYDKFLVILDKLKLNFMKLLKVSFRRNGLLYILLQRNDLAAIYGVGGTYSDRVSHYEVCKIYIRQDKYGERESIPNNEQFGRDLSRCFNNYKSAVKYFDELTKLYQGVSKVVTGVIEDIEMAA